MARAKNTTRAEARRRYRTLQGDTEDTLDGAGADPLATDAEPEPERRKFFRLPDLRGDLRALPSMFRTRRLLWLPFILVVLSFLAGMAVNRGLLPAGSAIDLTDVAVQLFLFPQALLTYFLGGFLATRGPYLVGMLLGALSGPLYSLWAVEALQTRAATEGVTFTLSTVLIPYTLQGIFFGALAAAFASWYRNFLRSSQERARANRVARDHQAIQKRKEQEREARRSVTRKPTAP